MLDTLAGWILSLVSEDWTGRIQYLTTGKHIAWYTSVRFNLLAAFFGAALAVIFGLLGAAAHRSTIAVCRWIGLMYTSMVRGIPDILFFLFFPLAFEQAFEFVKSRHVCSDAELASVTQWPPCMASQWYVSTTEYLFLACLSLGIIYGSYVANVVHGAMSAIPVGQIEAARAFGFTGRQVYWRFQVRQMWVYALPGLSNVWLMLFKATSLLSLLQIADIVFWADRLGAANFFASAGPVHPDWRWRYYLVLLIFYILVALVSEQIFKRVTVRVSRGISLT